MQPSTDFINEQRLWARTETLATFTLADVPWTRRAFSPLFTESRAWLTQEFINAGLTVHLDAAGNLIGRREGTQPGRKPIIMGSHCDTVVGGGRFDGIIGVLAGIEVAQVLHDQGVELAHPLEVIDFLSEEPSDYGVSCVGSRALSGVLTADMLAQKNAEGETLAQGIARIGGNPAVLHQVHRPSDSTAAFVELHIEQGPVLEDRQLPIGVVTDIVGIRRMLVMVHGQPDHAGTTPMTLRKDALVGAARCIDATFKLASQLSGNPHYVVATIGRIHMTPNVPNAVPGQVEMVLEVRSNSTDVLATFPDQMLDGIAADLQRLGLRADMSELTRSTPTACSPLVMDVIEQSAQALGYASMRMPSGAGHDAAYMAGTGPVGMIFIPCLNGRSHCPEEWIEPQQLLDGTRVLYDTILKLDQILAS